MQRRNFIKLIPATGLAGYTGSLNMMKVYSGQEPAFDTREYWLQVMTTIADPLLNALSREKLKSTMPVECQPGYSESRRKVTYLEAFGRLVAGMAPWLDLGAGNSEEGIMRKKYIGLTRQCLTYSVNPASPDFMNFTEGGQPLVDAAFLAQGLIRGFSQLWEPLDDQTKKNIVNALISTRIINPGYSNWLLFSAMIEIFLLKTGNSWDQMRVDFALKKHMEWYKGDGVYGDGPDFHWDYYNSYVIQPMLLDIVGLLVSHGYEKQETYDLVLSRARRYAVIQERMISPEGTFPCIGRSLAYRFGAFQLLSQIALMKQLPGELNPGAVRSGLSAVISKMIEAPGTFDKGGWLTIGFCGHQPEIGETYISTGSLYLCTTGMLTLGLPPGDEFWKSPSGEWTSRKAWSGLDLKTDHAL